MSGKWSLINNILRSQVQSNVNVCVSEHTSIQQETDTLVLHDTLQHRETLLVVASSDTEDVSLVLLSKRISNDLGRDALVIEEDTELLLVLEFDHLLCPGGGVRDIEL
tara:strand:+ start:178 stop:501 length:324 start_codon:yes stop_codon:yes gene_type:complete